MIFSILCAILTKTDDMGEGKMQLRNVVFDIGNVLADYRWYAFLQDKGFSPEMIDRIAGVSTQNPAWDEFDRGVLSSREVVESFIRLDPEIAAELHRAFDDLSGLLHLFPYSIPWIQRLKSAGYHVYYLSNYSRKAIRDCPEVLEFLPFVDGGIFSCDVKVIKPDPAIYHKLLETFRLIPEETVFLDDRQENIDGACRAGMKGIRFRSYEQAVQALAQLGIRC